jgi:hypothetical protein
MNRKSAELNNVSRTTLGLANGETKTAPVVCNSSATSPIVYLRVLPRLQTNQSENVQSTGWNTVSEAKNKVKVVGCVKIRRFFVEKNAKNSNRDPKRIDLGKNIRQFNKRK